MISSNLCIIRCANDKDLHRKMNGTCKLEWIYGPQLGWLKSLVNCLIIMLIDLIVKRKVNLVALSSAKEENQSQASIYLRLQRFIRESDFRSGHSVCTNDYLAC